MILLATKISMDASQILKNSDDKILWRAAENVVRRTHGRVVWSRVRELHRAFVQRTLQSKREAKRNAAV